MPKNKINFENDVNNNYKRINDLGTVINNKYKKIHVAKNIDNKTLIVYNTENNVKLLEFHYIFIGSYDIDKSIWMWSYNNFTLDNKGRLFKNKLDETMKNLLDNIDRYSDFTYVEKIYNYLSNDMCCVENKYILDIVKISLYSIGGKGVITEFLNISDVNKLDFYIIKDILVNNI
jgi:hypothetical protein